MKNRFVDQAEVAITPTGFRISYSHWTKRGANTAVNWADIKSLTAVQREPMLLTMRIETKGNRIHELDEQMQGWSEFLSELRKQFDAFDWDRLEDAKGAIDKAFVCWAKAGM